MARILYISFGYEPYWSGGMVKNVIGLMKNLVAIGHQVTYFTACRYDFKNNVYLSSRKVNSIETIEMVNSPNVYDPYCYRTNPKSHCSNSIIEKITMRVVDQVNPDIVHISDLRMHCASLIKLLRSRHFPVVKTMHNFWDLCPKGDLMFNDETPCVDFGDGRKCLICLSNYSEGKIPLMHRIKGSINYEVYFPYVKKFKRLKTFIPERMKQEISKTQLHSPNAYVERREYFIEMLNLCTTIHTTSKNIAQRFIAHGINPRIVKTIPLSAEGLTDIRAKINYEPHYPVIFGYRGKVHRRKGIQVLLSAFTRLDRDKCKLMIFGDGEVDLLKPYLHEGSNIIYCGKYNKEQINSVMSKIDVGIVPSIWEEIFGIVGPEYINARIPVIASNIGGISEWLSDGINGYLSKPGDSDELYRIMNRLVNEPQRIARLQKKIKPWKSVRTYAQEMSVLYQKVAR